MRDNYVNVCDITPTVYDLLGMAPPATVKGIAQKPLDGVSFKAALADPLADTGDRQVENSDTRQGASRRHASKTSCVRGCPPGPL